MHRLLIVVLLAALGIGPAAWAEEPLPGAKSDVPRTSPEPTNQSAEEIIIKAKLRAAGVRKVNNLARHPDGTWEGRGMKGDEEIAVQVDTDGNVKFR
ncbi:MAG: hypothetical protein KIT25_04015 [Enhydrobacter sp.]|nr:MAG: hypothetical protein KIT25_04015 [Enhydrobacter sp.]